MFKTIPNTLTLLRIVCIPVLLIVYYLPLSYAHTLAAIIFAIAGITDWWDGYLARKLNQVSKFGAFLDPVADKLIVATALIMIVGQTYLHFIVLPAAIIIGREILVSALREWMAQIGERSSVAVANIAKWKTFAQMIAITLLLAYSPRSSAIIVVLGYILLYVAAILTIWTMTLYLYAARHSFAD